MVSLRREGGEALLSVKDDGIGISDEDRENIWKRFWQADPSRGEDEGLVDAILAAFVAHALIGLVRRDRGTAASEAEEPTAETTETTEATAQDLREAAEIAKGIDR